MKGRTLGLLGGLAAVAVALAVWVTVAPGSNSASRQTGEALFPGLADSLPAVESITLSGPQGRATLSLRFGQWVVEERFGYRANRGQIRSLLSGMVRARRLEPKTADAARLESIGLGEGAVSLALAGAEGRVIAALRIGRARVPAAGESRKTFVWAEGDQRSWLVSSLPSLTTSPILWLDKEIFSLSNARLSGVTITRANGDILSLSGQANNVAALVVAGQSAEETLVGGPANVTLTALSSLQFEDVAPPSEIDGEAVATARYTTFDGLVVEVRVRAAASGESWAIFRAEYDAEAALNEENPRQMPDAPADGAAEAAALNAGWAGWIFQLSRTDAEALTRSRSDVIMAARKEDEPN